MRIRNLGQEYSRSIPDEIRREVRGLMRWAEAKEFAIARARSPGTSRVSRSAVPVGLVTENIHASGLPEVVGLLELRKLQELIRSRTPRIAHRMHLIIAVDVEIATGVPVDRNCSSSADARLDSRRLCRRTAEAPKVARYYFTKSRRFLVELFAFFARMRLSRGANGAFSPVRPALTCR